MLENLASAMGCSPHLRFSWIKGHVQSKNDPKHALAGQITGTED